MAEQYHVSLTKNKNETNQDRAKNAQTLVKQYHVSPKFNKRKIKQIGSSKIKKCTTSERTKCIDISHKFNKRKMKPI